MYTKAKFKKYQRIFNYLLIKDSNLLAFASKLYPCKIVMYLVRFLKIINKVLQELTLMLAILVAQVLEVHCPR